MKPLVSIIIPAFNREKLIKETLDSIAKQSYVNWECIVVDDGSTDKTEQVVKVYIKKDKRFQYHKRPIDRLKGANACRNYGFETSKGNYIQWFDSDDLMHQDKIKIKVEELLQSNVDFVVCQGVEYNGTIENVICKWDNIASENILKDHITGNVNFHTNGPMFKRCFLGNKTLFNENLQRKQEWEFYSRLLTYSKKYIPIKKELYYFRVHEQSINGQNSIKTLKSRIQANKLVFNLVKQNFYKEDLEALKTHFFNKYILFLKIAIQSKKTNLIFVSFYAILVHLTPKMIRIGFLKIVKNPKIIRNILS